MRIKQSVCLPMYLPPGTNLDDLCRSIAEIGYSVVETWFRGDDFPQFVETVSKNNLRLVSFIAHHTLDDGLNKYENHDRIETELIESIDIASDLNVPGVICFSGNRNEGQSDYEGMVACAHGLRRVAPYAEKKGVNLNIELLNSKIDHPGYQCDRTDWAVALCEMVNSPRVKLLFDIYHMQIMEGDIIRSIRKHIKWVGHFHTAGNPGRRELDDTQELNYIGICKAIVTTDYDLYLGHEFGPKDNAIEALSQAFALCDQE